MDEAVFTFGVFVEAQLNNATSKVKDRDEAIRIRMSVVNDILSDHPGQLVLPETTSQRKFRDPADVLGKAG